MPDTPPHSAGRATAHRSGAAPDRARAEQLSSFAFIPGYRLSLVLDPDGRVRTVTEASGDEVPAPEALLGLTLVEISSLVVGPERGAEWAKRVAAARDATQTAHYADPPPDGADDAAPTVGFTVTPVRTAEGALQAIIVVIEDRSAFLSTQRALHDSEDRLRVLAESLPQMVWTSTSLGQVDYFSPRWSAFTGRSNEQLLGTGFQDLIHPDDRAALHEIGQAGQFDEPVTFRLQRYDGVYRTMEAHMHAVRDQDGSLLRLVGGTTDITDRRASEDRERELREQLHSALQLTGLGQFATNLRSQQVYADDRLAEILGLPPTSLIDGGSLEMLMDLIHPEDRPRVERALEVAFAGGPDFDEEYRSLRPAWGEPEVRWVAVLAHVEFDDEGPAKLVGVMQDITDRRQQDEARLRSQKREAIGTLAGGIAHDFNNVIAAILSNAAVAQTELERNLSPATSIHEIRRGASRAADLVQRMLSHSREDEPTWEPVDLGAVAEEAVALVQATMPPNVELSAQTAAHCTALGDASQLHQVVMNLVTNAADALRDAGGGRIEVRVDAVAKAPASSGVEAPTGRCVRLRVIDDGPGMPEHVARRAFDPFFTTKPAGEGTGLGLAATQTIVSGHRGTVRIDSVPGQQTVVTVLLPATEPPGAAVREGAGAGDAAPAPSTAKATVLFVDDERALAQLAARAMPAYGCTPAVFTDPIEALAALTAAPEHYDALVTDLSMPGLSGLELAARARAVRPGLPIILTSGFLTPAQEAEASGRGVDLVIAKPCSMEQLASAVLRLVGGAGGPDPTTPG